MNLIPLNDRVIVKPKEKETTTVSGIVLPDSAVDAPLQGEVIAITDDLDLHREVSVGDIVIFGKYAGTIFTIDNEKLLIMKEEDIIAKVIE